MAKKLITAAIALVISFALWMYVVMVIGPEYKDTYRNVEVSIVGDLKDDLMILGDQKFTVDLVLSGNRSDLNKINAGSIEVELDRSQIQQEGTSPYRYEIVNLPDSITIESYSPARITLEVVKRAEKTVTLDVDYDEDMIPQGYGVMSVEPEFEKIVISGPEDQINRVALARVSVNLTDKNNKIGIDNEEYDIVYLDENGRKISAANITPQTEGAEKITVNMPIGIKKEIPLRVYVVEGGGVTAQNVTIDPPTITVLGTEEDLQNLSECYLNRQDDPIDLGALTEEFVNEFEIDLPDGVINKSGYDKATVTVSFDGLIERKFVIKQEQGQIQMQNIPEGLLPVISEKQITITIRGAEAVVNSLTEADILVAVDFANAKIGLKDWELVITIKDNPADAGVIGGPYTINVEMKDAAEVAQQAGQEGNQGAVALVRT